MINSLWSLVVSLLNLLFNNTPLFYLTQSVWRDEAFSYFMAKPDVIKIIINTANDFNPPLYYILLHFWIYISGNSDIYLRILSFIFHLIGVYYAFLIGRKISSKRWAFYLTLFYFLNPMLIYYAFEIRMYSLFAMLSTAAIYYASKKDFRKYTISSILGLYSHSFFILVIFSIGIMNFLKSRSKKILLRYFSPILFFLPWIPILAIQFVKSKESWLYPVDWQLIKSSLGNIFTGYEGTPGHLWPLTAWLSLFILFFMYLAFKNKKLNTDIFILPIVLPLFLILTYSVLKRPLFVNRYLIFISVFEVITVFIGIISIRNNNLRKLSAFAWLIFIIYFNLYTPPFREKTDFASTFKEINQLAQKKDFVFTRTPIAYLESAFYYKYPSNSFVYNPQNIHIPNYIGVNVIFPDVSRSTFPQGPSKTFMVNDDASFEIIEYR